MGNGNLWRVTYSYNLGGQLTHVRGYKSYGYDYVNKIGYDKFEQRTYLKYCNGVETFYSYDPQRRRLQNLAVNAGGKTIMDNAYGYDIVSNVLSVKNNAPLPQSGKAGGQMSHSYTYDPLYRLASATGTYNGADNKTASYTLTMGYDNMYRITSKKQHLTQSNVQFNGSLNAGYDLTYTYNNDEGKKFQLASVRDINYRTEETPTDSTNINNGHKYTYDANGNLVYINTSRVKKDNKEDDKASEQKYKWDEENRLLAADENGFVSNYWYDADGERTVKTSGENEAIFVNSEFSGGNTGTARFSLYVSPYLVAGQGGKYTKHIYVGSQRIVSKLGDLASYGADPRKIPYAGNEADGVTINYKDKYNQQLQSIKDNYKTFDLPYNGVDNTDYVNGKGFSSDDDTPEAAQTRAMVKTRAGEAGTNERMQFYYHPDHLGSSSYITNLDGEVMQHIEYVPFGEVFIEERNNTWNTPYLFNAKEFDEETGMYYYGARYYEPRLSLWMSVDPMQEKYPNVSSYCYTFNNPVKFIDPDGQIAWVAVGAIAGGIINAGIAAYEGKSGREIAGAALSGAVNGALIASGAGLITTAAVGTAASLTETYIGKGHIRGRDVGESIVSNAVGATLGAGAGRLIGKGTAKLTSKIAKKYASASVQNAIRNEVKGEIKRALGKTSGKYAKRMANEMVTRRIKVNFQVDKKMAIFGGNAANFQTQMAIGIAAGKVASPAVSNGISTYKRVSSNGKRF